MVGADDFDAFFMGVTHKFCKELIAEEKLYIEEVDEAGGRNGPVQLQVPLGRNILRSPFPLRAESEKEGQVPQFIAQLRKERQDRQKAQGGDVVQVVDPPFHQVYGQSPQSFRLV